MRDGVGELRSAVGGKGWVVRSKEVYALDF